MPHNHEEKNWNGLGADQKRFIENNTVCRIYSALNATEKQVGEVVVKSTDSLRLYIFFRKSSSRFEYFII